MTEVTDIPYGVGPLVITDLLKGKDKAFRQLPEDKRVKIVENWAFGTVEADGYLVKALDKSPVPLESISWHGCTILTLPCLYRQVQASAAKLTTVDLTNCSSVADTVQMSMQGSIWTWNSLFTLFEGCPVLKTLVLSGCDELYHITGTVLNSLEALHMDRCINLGKIAITAPKLGKVFARSTPKLVTFSVGAAPLFELHLDEKSGLWGQTGYPNSTIIRHEESPTLDVLIQQNPGLKTLYDALLEEVRKSLLAALDPSDLTTLKISGLPSAHRLPVLQSLATYSWFQLVDLGHCMLDQALLDALIAAFGNAGGPTQLKFAGRHNDSVAPLLPEFLKQLSRLEALTIKNVTLGTLEPPYQALRVLTIDQCQGNIDLGKGSSTLQELSLRALKMPDLTISCSAFPGLRRLEMERLGLNEKACSSFLSQLGTLSHLEHLNLSGNILNSEQGRILGHQLLSMVNLRSVDLSNCWSPEDSWTEVYLLSGLGPLTRLESLKLRTTDSTLKLLRTIGQLQTLVLESTLLSDSGIEALATTLEAKTALIHLNIRFPADRQKIPASHVLGEVALNSLSSALQKLTDLRYLNLSGLRFPWKCQAALGNTLGCLTRLEELHLKHCFLIGLSFTNQLPGNALAKGLQQLGKLRVCDLGGNYMGGGGPNAQFVTPLLRCWPKLARFRFSDTALGLRGSLFLARDLPISNHLVWLELGSRSGSNPDMVEVEPLGRALGQLPQLRHLALRGMGLDSLRMKALVPGFKELGKLRSLDLTGNTKFGEMTEQISASGVFRGVAFGQWPSGLSVLINFVLPTVSQLKYLSLEDCGIAAWGVDALAAKPELLSCLKELNLRNNLIDLSGSQWKKLPWVEKVDESSTGRWKADDLPDPI